jgi:Leucine-rich repeat (LRR) protein
LFANKLESFDGSHCELTIIDLGRNLLPVFPVLPPTAVSLNLDGNTIEVIEGKYPALVRLCIGLNLVRLISPDAQFQSLSVLDISRNRLTSLPDLELLCPALQKFDASDNQISDCPKFPRSTSEILFSNNRLTSVPENFSTLLLLCRADFSRNMIRSVPTLPAPIQLFAITDNDVETIEQHL